MIGFERLRTPPPMSTLVICPCLSLLHSFKESLGYFQTGCTDHTLGQTLHHDICCIAQEHYQDSGISCSCGENLVSSRLCEYGTGSGKGKSKNKDREDLVIALTFKFLSRSRLKSEEHENRDKE